MTSATRPLALAALSFSLIAGCGAAPEMIEVDEVATTAQALDTSGDGIGAPLEIPLVLVLWENPGYGGTKSTIIRDQADLRPLSFNDKTSAIGVHPGPSYASWKARHSGAEPTVTIYADPSYTGRCARLSAGAYASTGDFGFNDNITSARFNDGVACNRVTSSFAAATIGYIPVALEIYADPSFNGSWTTLVQASSDLRAQYGGTFNDSITSVRLLMGPNYTAGRGVRLHRDAGYLGGGIDVLGAPQSLPDLRNLNFNDVAGAVEFR